MVWLFPFMMDLLPGMRLVRSSRMSREVRYVLTDKGRADTASLRSRAGRDIHPLAIAIVSMLEDKGSASFGEMSSEFSGFYDPPGVEIGESDIVESLRGLTQGGYIERVY